MKSLVNNADFPGRVTYIALFFFILLQFFFSIQGIASPVNSGQVVKLAPEFSLDSANNTRVNIRDFKGKVVYLDFWASWCGPCRASFPWMNKMQEKYKGEDFKILAINLDEDKEAVSGFLDKYPAEFTILFDPQAKTPDDYKVMGMPSSYLINREGKIISSHIGFQEVKIPQYEKEIYEALMKSSGHSGK